MERPETRADADEPPAAWHAVTDDEARRLLRSRPQGLSEEEAAARRERVGPNLLEETPPPGILTVVLDQFRSPLIYILLVAMAVTILLGEYLDSWVIGAALGLNATVGTVQQAKAERSVRALQQLLTPKANVVRGGQVQRIESRDLVPGDVVVLESGDRVPADLRLARTTTLTVDESLLTGESLPVTKGTEPLPADATLADRTNLAFSGTVVARGRAHGYVVATGQRTELGRIAEQIRTGESPATPLQGRIERFAKVIGLAVVIAATLAFVAGLSLGESANSMFLIAVALAVSAVPEGLPVVLTVVLAVGVSRMARRQAIIRRLQAVETLGSITVICSDKTGTLTRNEMTVQELRTASGRFVADATSEPDDIVGPEHFADRPELYLTLLAGVLASEASIYREDGVLQVTGDPTEAAVVRAAATAGLEPARLRAEHPPSQHLPFEPERRYAAVICTIGDTASLLVQGAPERVLEMCTQQLCEGRSEELDRRAAVDHAEDMAASGLRVLGFAERRGTVEELEGLLEHPTQLRFLGLQGMADPARDGVPDAVDACHDAGIRVVMVTGDHAATGSSIARAIGLRGSGPAVTGAEIEGFSDDELQARLADTPVYARVAPEHKLRIVEAFRREGEVVAVTGDGVNDAPALRSAHVGIAMGRDGTDVAREAADVVLADDNFVSIRAAVEQGRVAFDNLRKATFFLISTGAAEIVMVITGLVLGWPLVLLPAQLLWLNVVTNGLQDMALAFEPGDPDILRRRPRPPGEGLVSKLLWQRTVLVAIVMAIGCLVMFDRVLGSTGSLEAARSATVTTMVLFQTVMVGNARVEHRSAFSSPPWRNRFLLVTVVVALTVHAGALSFPPTQWVLRVQPLSIEQWAAAAAVSLSALVAVEIDKAVRRRRGTSQGRRPVEDPHAVAATDER